MTNVFTAEKYVYNLAVSKRFAKGVSAIISSKNLRV